MSKHKETMSNVDTAWLQMDRPTNLMMIASFMTFDEPINSNGCWRPSSAGC